MLTSGNPYAFGSAHPSQLQQQWDPSTPFPSSTHRELLCQCYVLPKTSGQSFVYGNNLAFSYLPQNWRDICMVASLFPDASIVLGDRPVPLPSFDSVIGRNKRAIQFIPLLATLGITAAFSMGTAGLGYSLQTYQQLSRQLINDVDLLSSTIQVVQDQLDSLAEVVLQNRRGLDLLTAEKGGLCLALNEQCCFYANRSGIVRNKIKTLQEDLAK
ncbi:envelope glycoprotein [Plecturocebus cupreus]